MPRIISEKKKAESSNGKQGRTKHRKLTSYIVTQYLLKNTDEDHLTSVKDIIDYPADFGRSARSDAAEEVKLQGEPEFSGSPFLYTKL